MNALVTRIARNLGRIGICAGIAVLAGCEWDGFMDPSKTGYFEPHPTTIEILDRIDMIETEDDAFANATEVQPEDLLPVELTYRIGPGDVLTVSIFELLGPGQEFVATRRVDAAGNIRLPHPLGDFRSAGLTAGELQAEVTEACRKIINEPQVFVSVEDGAGLRYTLYGAIPGPGVYSLRRPDFRLLDALALAGGAPVQIKNIYVIREVPLMEGYRPDWGQTPMPDRGGEGGDEPVDIDELLKTLEGDGMGSFSIHGDFTVSPSALRQQNEPVIDIDDLEPARTTTKPVVSIDDVESSGRRPQAPSDDQQYIYIPERNEWVLSPRGRGASSHSASMQGMSGGGDELVLERIIRVPYEKLLKGDSSYNIVIHPNDRVYVATPDLGVVYLEGEIFRPGVYNLSGNGIFTLSRLVASAGGLGPLAIPERVDITRVISENREATIRVNLAAIRNRTEPDIILKPDDHVMIGTNFIATPLAVLRRGLRATYGFGFLLDRNFGNDVFGAPPTNRAGF